MTITTVFYDEEHPAEPRALDITMPESVTGAAVCLVHGGGWYAGERAAYHEVMSWFVERGHPCASVGYRTDEDSSFADKVRDVATGYLLFADVLQGRGYGPPVLMGSSAGAHLATVLTEVGPETWAPDAARDWRAPAGCIPVNGPGTLEEWRDIPPTIKAAVEQMCDATYADDPQAFRDISPDYLVPDTPTPPFLVLLAENEECFPHEYVYPWVRMLRDVGTRVVVEVIPGTSHGFLYTTDGQPQQRALAIVEGFLRQLPSLNSAHAEV